MPRRVILTDAERHDFLALPIDDETLIRHWTLDDDDHRLLQTRRRSDTRLGLALQLCALRYPGRLIRREETIPEASLVFLAEQLNVEPGALADFARRAPTRYEQLAILRHQYSFTELTHPLRADLLAFARGMALAAAKDNYVVSALADEMRQRRIVIRGITVLERLAGQACTEAEEALFADVAGRLTPDLIVRMEVLLGMGPRARQSGISWLREPRGKAGASSMRGLIDRLEAVRNVSLPAEVLLVDRRWRKEIIGADGAIDRKMLELFLIVELKNRIAAGEICIKGSRAYRALDEHMISQATFAIIKAEARITVAIPVDVEVYLEQKAAALDLKLREAAYRLETGRGETRIGAKGLRVPAVKNTETEAALAFAKRVATSMPPIRLTDLVADIDRMTGFSSLFEHLQTGRPPSDLRVFFAALITEATNLGFSKMALACPGITRRQLQQMAIWHFREETFALALAGLVEAQHADPFAATVRSETISSSDGQHIHLGDGGEVAGGVNGRYGTNPIIKLYTSISGRYAPFHVKIIAATASEAVHVLDALLETDAGLDISRHHVDGGGVSDLVFALCHPLGFAFVPRIPDLDGRCLYGFGPAKQYGILQNVMGDRIDADLIRNHWDDILRLMTSLRTRTVSASLMLRRLSATTRQSGLAQALRQMGRIERTLFTLDWINNEDLRKTTTAELNKGESRNSLVRAVNLHRLGRFRDRSQENLSIRASALNLVVTAIIYWNTIYTGRVVDAMRNAGLAVPAHLLASSHGSM